MLAKSTLLKPKILILFLLLAYSGFARDVFVKVENPSKTTDYALGKLGSALSANGDQLSLTAAADAEVDVRVEAKGLSPEGFALRRVGKALEIDGADARGAMYGILDCAEQIRQGTAIEKIHESKATPAMQFRAIKFNLPFAPYRGGPLTLQHAETCKDLKFWEAFLDMMAENRFNTLTLWSLDPFPYMVQSKSFPEGRAFSDAEMVEWKKLWTGIFAMAKERGIETYLINWNIFVSPQFARAHDVARWSENWSAFGQGAATNEIIVPYTREMITQVIDEYPDLSGLGITLGERMGDMTPAERRDWLDKSIIAGIADAKRSVKFIYRAPLSANTGSGGSASTENDRLSREQIDHLTNNIIAPVFVDFKHNWSHGHSSPDLFIVHGGKLSDAYWNPLPTNHKVVWTMRNEDFFVLRWGQPDFVRQFVHGKQRVYDAGAIIGSECYVPALDYISKDGPGKTGKYAFDRQWLFYSTWGRLLYDPATPDSRFEGMLESRFGKGTGRDLLAAWKLASQVPLDFASFYMGDWDGSLYTEGFSSWHDGAERKLFDIDTFIEHPVLDTKRFVNIADYVKTGKVAAGQMTPNALADRLDQDGVTALKLVAGLQDQRKANQALDCEATDIEAWCAFGNYFADKLRAGVLLATARAKGDPASQKLAVAQLEKAVVDWNRLSDLGGRFNQLPIKAPTKEPFSWASMLPQVEHDIELAKAPLPSRRNTP
jgi:hypothetical protein